MKDFKKSAFLALIIIFSVAHYSQSQDTIAKQIESALNDYIANTVPYKLYLRTDKSIYESKEQIWITGILLDRKTNKPIDRSATVDIDLRSQSGVSISNRTFDLTNGIGEFTLSIPNLVSNGTFELYARLAEYPHVFWSKQLELRKNAIPSFIINAVLDKKYLAAGETFNIYVEAKDYFSTPLRGANIVASLCFGNDVLLVSESKTDKSGATTLQFTLPEVLKKVPVYLKLIVSNKLLIEEYSLPIPVKNDMVYIDFFPGGGQLVHGMANLVKVRAYDIFGFPFPFEAVIVDEKGSEIFTLISDDKGNATLPLLPDYTRKLALVIKKPYAIDSQFELPRVNHVGISFSVTPRTDDSVRIIIKPSPSQETQKIHLINVNNGRLFPLFEIDLHTKKDFILPKKALKPGVNQLVIFNSEGYPLAEELFYFPPGKVPQNISGISDNYLNREKIDFDLNVTKSTLYSVSVIDEFRMSQNGAQSSLSSFLYLNSEILPFNSSDEGIHLTEPAAINEELKYRLPRIHWNDVYLIDNEKIEFNYPHEFVTLMALSSPLRLLPRNNVFYFTNYSYEPFYLSANPDLFKLLRKEEKRELKPPYKMLLENGTPLREVIYIMKPYEIINNGIVFLGYQNSLIAQQGALIVVNGVRAGENIGVLDQISPFDVDEIKISTTPSEIHNYTGLNSVGVIDIKFKNGALDTANVEEPEKTEFEIVDHEKDKKEWKNRPDLRTTIHWIPFGKSSSTTEDISFFHSDIRGKFIGTVEGVDENGIPFNYQFEYESIKYAENQ